MTIKEARQAAKLTQAEAARCLGIPKRTLQDWESGNRNPKEAQERICERISIIGMLTSDAREGLANGEISFEELAPTYKLQQVKKLTGWGRYPDTFQAIIDNIPDSVFRRLPAQELAELVDAMQAVYQQGVGYGRGTKEA